MEVCGVRLHVEERGSGAPILCIHGTGGSASGWYAAVETLAGLGRVIAYDRRGCGRSERPEPYPRTSVREHAEDAAALLAALGAAPAVCIGRSYGGTVATTLALHHPEAVRALVLLESDASRELAPATAAWVDGLAERLGAVAAHDGADAVGEALISAVAGPAVWPALPDDFRATLTGNGPAILAELAGAWWLDADLDALAGLRLPTLLVCAADSPPELRAPTEALARAIPGAELSVVPGGHLIDPAAPEILAFVAAVLR